VGGGGVKRAGERLIVLALNVFLGEHDLGAILVGARSGSGHLVSLCSRLAGPGDDLQGEDDTALPRGESRVITKIVQ